MGAYPVHHCRIDNPCPVLIGTCEGPDPAKWGRPDWLMVYNIDADLTGGNQ
jgi:hypothetical protein